MNNVCRDCMLEKHLNRYPEGASEEAVKEYQEAVRRLTDRVGAAPSGPEVYCGIRAIRKRLFGEGEIGVCRDQTALQRPDAGGRGGT